MRTILGLLFGLAALSSRPALAQMIVDPAYTNGDNNSSVAPVLQASEIEYNGHYEDFDIDRTILGVEFSMGVAPVVDIFGDVGLIAKTEIEDWDDDGQGFTLGAGGRGVVWSNHLLSVVVYGLYDYQRESFEGHRGGRGWKFKMETWELHGGGTCTWLATPKVHPYAGVDHVLVDDGEGRSTYDGIAGTAKTDIDREDIINLKVGSHFLLGKAILRPEATIMGERTITASALFTF